jgi:hypothetical protein
MKTLPQPWSAVETAGKIPFVPDYTIITQDWGVMVGLMGIFMITAGGISNEFGRGQLT